MDQKFSVQVRSGGGYTYLKLRGVIDEDNNLSALLGRMDAEVVVLDLSEVDRINSYGVRDWVNWLGDIESAGRRLVMMRCSPAIVGQANMVTNFCARAVIMSFFAPYFCPSCEQPVNKLLNVEQFLDGAAIKAPDYLCDVCGAALEFDDFEESYFAFLQAVDPSQISSEMRRVVEDVAPDLERKIKALNEGRITQLSGPLHTASMEHAEGPGSGSYGGLIRSVGEAQRAAIIGDLPEKVREAVGRAGQGAQSNVAAPPPALAAPASSEVASPKGVQPSAAPSSGAAASKPGGSLGALLLVLLPYALIGVALLVVAVLLFLVLTIK